MNTIQNPARAVMLRDIIRAVKYDFDVTHAELMQSRGPQRLADARFACYWLARELTPLSSQELGTRFKRDHTVILYGAKRCAELMETDPRFKQQLELLRDGLLRGHLRA